MEGCQIERYVIDASIAVKWFAHEEDSEVARKIRDSFLAGLLDMLAPSLMYYEVVNALRFHPDHRFLPEELRAAVRALRKLGFAIEPTDDLWFRSCVLSLQEGISIYDSMYLALASHQGKFITADSRLLERLSGRVKDDVILLSEVKLGFGT